MIGERIHQARKAAGLTLRALAEKVDISAMAISKYETNKSIPSSTVLLSLSSALGVPVDYFFRTSKVELRDVDYRKHAKLPKKVLQQIDGDVIEQVERYLELEEYLPVSPVEPFKIPDGLPDSVREYDDVERVADAVRQAWGLGSDPIPGLIDTLEEKGIKVLRSRALHGEMFDGLAAQVNGAPVIVIGRDWPGDRQRFTLAHELGHLILKGRLAKSLDEEAAAHRFAGAFLAPASEVIKELGASRTWLEPRELCVLKKAYGLSMNAWKHRAKDLGILSAANYLRIVHHFRKQGWHKKEPCEQYRCEEPQLFLQLVFHALAEELISESKAAELLRVSLAEFRAIRNVNNDAANAAHQ